MSRPLRWIPVFLPLLLAPATAVAQSAAPPATSTAPAVTVSPGDVLKVTVWGHEDMSGEFVVGPGGALVHPLYREFQVAGLPLPAMEDRFRTYLQRWEANPRFVVEPLLHVLVGGAVAKPGYTNVPPGTTIAQAIVLAGGTGSQPGRAEVTLRRDGARQTFDRESEAARAPVHSDDEISVSVIPRRGFASYLSPLASLVSAVIGIVSLATR
jgi:polysaccharide export outer membrane protein